MNDHKAATADIAGARIGHCHGEADRDRGVDGVATLAQYIGADACRDRLLRDDHAVRSGDRLRLFDLGVAPDFAAHAKDGREEAKDEEYGGQFSQRGFGHHATDFSLSPP